MGLCKWYELEKIHQVHADNLLNSQQVSATVMIFRGWEPHCPLTGNVYPSLHFPSQPPAQARLPSDLSSPAGASTWGGIYIPGILCAFGGPCRSHVGEGGGSRRRAGPLATSAAPVGNERPLPTFLHEEAQCCMNLQVLALTHGERRWWYSSKLPHLSSGCTHATVSSSQLEDSNAWKGPWHVVDLSVSCCWSLQMRKLRLREGSEQGPIVTVRCRAGRRTQVRLIVETWPPWRTHWDVWVERAAS